MVKDEMIQISENLSKCINYDRAKTGGRISLLSVCLPKLFIDLGHKSHLVWNGNRFWGKLNEGNVVTFNTQNIATVAMFNTQNVVTPGNWLS